MKSNETQLDSMMLTNEKIAILGAGVLGRNIALNLVSRGIKPWLYDHEGIHPPIGKTASIIAAGMLSPFCELEYSESLISELGIESLALWPGILNQLGNEVFFQNEGTLVVAHPRDSGELSRIKEKCLNLIHLQKDIFKEVQESEIDFLEADLEGRFSSALFFPFEGQIDPTSFFNAFNKHIIPKVHFKKEFVIDFGPGWLKTEKGRETFDWIIDVRGLGARKNWPENNLRGVRGEIIKIYAPHVKIIRPIRFFHPRYPLYLVPRPNGEFFLGATNIENEDLGEISVRSSLELLSAAMSLHPGLGEGKIIFQGAGLRPSFLNNIPKISMGPGLIKINGLYRHGYLCSPILAQMVGQLLFNEEVKVFKQIIGDHNEN